MDRLLQAGLFFKNKRIFWYFHFQASALIHPYWFFLSPGLLYKDVLFSIDNSARFCEYFWYVLRKSKLRFLWRHCFLWPHRSICSHSKTGRDRRYLYGAYQKIWLVGGCLLGRTLLLWTGLWSWIRLQTSLISFHPLNTLVRWWAILEWTHVTKSRTCSTLLAYFEASFLIFLFIIAFRASVGPGTVRCCQLFIVLEQSPGK